MPKPKRVTEKCWALQVQGGDLEGAKYVDARGAHDAMCRIIQDYIDWATHYDRINVQHLHEALLQCRNLEHDEAECDVLVDTHWKRRFAARVVRLKSANQPSLL